MNLVEFQEATQRLYQDFSKDYGVNQTKILFRDVKDLTKWDYNNIIDAVLSTYDRLPAIKHVRKEISLYREKKWQREQIELKQDAAHFFNPTNHPEEVRIKIAMIKKRIAGECPDKEWNEFTEMLRKNTERSEANETTNTKNT